MFQTRSSITVWLLMMSNTSLKPERLMASQELSYSKERTINLGFFIFHQPCSRHFLSRLIEKMLQGHFWWWVKIQSNTLVTVFGKQVGKEEDFLVTASKCEELMHLGVISGVVLGQQLCTGFPHSQLHVWHSLKLSKNQIFIPFLDKFIFCQTIELNQLPEESERCQAHLQAQTCSWEEEDLSFPSSQFSQVSPRDMPKQPSAQLPPWPALLQNPTATIPPHRARLKPPRQGKEGLGR